jgi:exosortase A
MGEVADSRYQGRGVLWLLLALFVLPALVFSGTASSIVSIWHRSNVYAHAYLIPPVAAWLIWRRRERLAGVPIRPSVPWLLAVGLLGFGWLVGRIGNAMILEQYAFALFFPALIGAVLGTAMIRALLFPLAFLLLSVPAGDALSQPLMEFTAAFTVRALHVSGVPVVRNGPFLTLPNCEWAITDACSGFRYLVASFTLGCLYANLRFRTWRFRLLFVALSAALPILANGLRAYVIIMLGYLSDMKLAVGVDHYIYGWVLFALYSLLLFWIGGRLREPPAEEGGRGDSAQPGEPVRIPLGRVAAAAAVATLAMGLWPAAHAARLGAAPASRAVRLELPATAGPWEAVSDPLALWRPDYTGAASEAVQAYRRGDDVVVVCVAYYRGQRQGAELINLQNDIVHLRNPDWRLAGSGERRIRLEGRPATFSEARVTGNGERFLVWHRFWLQGGYTTNPYVAQLYELKNRMLLGKDDAALVAVLSRYGQRPEEAAAAMHQFLESMEPSLDASLRRASEGS